MEAAPEHGETHPDYEEEQTQEFTVLTPLAEHQQNSANCWKEDFLLYEERVRELFIPRKTQIVRTDHFL